MAKRSYIPIFRQSYKYIMISESLHGRKGGSRIRVGKGVVRLWALGKTEKNNQPSEVFELTANSLGAHFETHGGLI